MHTSVLKPGFLVSLKTSIRGGVNYRRVDVSPEHTTDEGATVATWETTREVPDPEEFTRATVARGAARSTITAACCASAFGLLCPIANESALQDAISAARDITNAHNAGASRTHVDVYVLVGRIAQDDAEAARAISAEVRELLESMKAGIAAADPTAIREAATKAKNLGGMLSSGAAERVSAAITEARQAAREIVKRIEKGGETAAAVVQELKFERIESARFSFLDMDEGGEMESEAPAGRGIDYEPAPAAIECAAPASLALEF